MLVLLLCRLQVEIPRFTSYNTAVESMPKKAMSRKNRDEWNTSELRWRGIWAETQEITSRKTREGPFDWLISCFSVCGGQFTDDRLTDWSIDWKVLPSLKVYRSKNLLPASAGHYFPEGEKQPTHTLLAFSRETMNPNKDINMHR